MSACFGALKGACLTHALDGAFCRPLPDLRRHGWLRTLPHAWGDPRQVDCASTDTCSFTPYDHSLQFLWLQGIEQPLAGATWAPDSRAVIMGHRGGRQLAALYFTRPAPALDAQLFPLPLPFQSPGAERLFPGHTKAYTLWSSPALWLLHAGCNSNSSSLTLIKT